MVVMQYFPLHIGDSVLTSSVNHVLPRIGILISRGKGTCVIGMGTNYEC